MVSCRVSLTLVVGSKNQIDATSYCSIVKKEIQNVVLTPLDYDDPVEIFWRRGQWVG